jgi:hypothetical protein
MTPRQLLKQLDTCVKRLQKSKISIEQIMKNKKIIQLIKEYNSNSGFIISNWELKRRIKFYY